MPTAASNTFSNAGITPLYQANESLQHHCKFGINLTIAKGTVVGQITATGLWAAYATGASDGTETARGIAAYDFTTDGSGNHTIGGGEMGEKQTSAPVFFAGIFRTSELTGLDAAAVVELGRLASGTVSDGVLVIPG